MIKAKIPAAKMGRSKRDFLTLSNDDLSKPGPGNYDVIKQNKPIVYSMSGKPKEFPMN